MTDREEAKKIVRVISQRGDRWWARLERRGMFMERGPYRFKWMAQAAFPIQRWFWNKGRS